MTLVPALLTLYPHANPMRDFIVQDDGSGPHITYWDEALGPQPTQAQIDAADAQPSVATPSQVFSQDLIAQFTVADYTMIKAAIASNDAMALMWAQMQAQKDPMIVTNARFVAGWAALVQVLGQSRMTAIALALGATIS